MKWINRKERFELIGFKDVKLRLFGVPILAFLFSLMVMEVQPYDKIQIFIIGWIISMLFTFFYWELDRFIVIYFRKKFHRFEDYRKRLILQSFVIIFSTLTFCSFSIVCQEPFKQTDNPVQVSTFNYLIANLIITTIVVSIYEGLYAFEKYKSGLIKNEELVKENTKAQLEALKNQVNPHFFFNSINTLVSVIPENPEIAVKFAENLSHVYRCILDMKDKEIVSLAEEFSCIEAYKYLLKIRFNDQVKFKGDDALRNIKDQYIVPMSVQMLVENAVKHNVVSQSRPLTIDFEINDDYLEVSNKLEPKNEEANSTKIGLNNIQKRYELVADKSIIIYETDERFSVSLPILKIQEVT